MRNIYLPVVDAIEIDGYVLYPGSADQPGLRHVFVSGVNVIVGVNGIGKTTLLLILLRMLTGNADMPDREELGGAQRRLVTTDTGLFAVRVPDRGRDATATLRMRIGDRKIQIVRNLSNLQLQQFSLDPADPPVSESVSLEEQYRAAVCKLCGVDDFFDFVLLLRYLTFYLEDRRSLLWDKWAQTEVLRILFIPEEFQKEYKKSLSDALTADSGARNTQAVLTRERVRLAKLLGEVAQSTPDELRSLRLSVATLIQRAEQLGEQLASLDEQRRSRRNDAEQRRHDAERLAQEERGAREALLASFFPKLTDYGAFVLANIQSGRGCVVCGTQTEKHLAQVSARIEQAICPLCGSDPSIQESQSVVESGDAVRARLETMSVDREAAKRAALAAEKDAADAQLAYLAIQQQKDAVDYDLKVSKQKLSLKERLAQGAQPEQLAKADERVRMLEDSVKEQLRDKDLSLRALSTLVQRLTAGVEQFKSSLIAKFDDVVSSFLSERCNLDYRTVLRRVGQGGTMQIEFPEFHVLLTSGVFRLSGTAREESSSVSESQKEFAELAFRMTFLSVVSQHSSCSLVLETPESNLDAVFIPRAGMALNGFASPEQVKHTVIATSNLNGSEMIPALLGILGSNVVATPKERVLNLLEFAAKSQALRDYSAEYQQRFNEAVTPSGSAT